MSATSRRRPATETRSVHAATIVNKKNSSTRDVRLRTAPGQRPSASIRRTAGSTGTPAREDARPRELLVRRKPMGARDHRTPPAPYGQRMCGSAAERAMFKHRIAQPEGRKRKCRWVPPRALTRGPPHGRGQSPARGAPALHRGAAGENKGRVDGTRVPGRRARRRASRAARWPAVCSLGRRRRGAPSNRGATGFATLSRGAAVGTIAA